MDASGKVVCAFVGEPGLLDGGGCGGVRSQLGHLPNVDWLGLDGEPLTLPNLAKLCRERMVGVVVVAVDVSDDAEPPDVALERVWRRLPPEHQPGLVTVLFGGEEFERPHAITLADSSKWLWRGLAIACFSYPFFLDEIKWAIEQTASFASDALRMAEHHVPPSKLFPTCFGWGQSGSGLRPRTTQH